MTKWLHKVKGGKNTCIETLLLHKLRHEKPSYFLYFLFKTLVQEQQGH